MSSKKIRVAIGALVMLLISAIIGYVAVDRSKTRQEEASQAEKDAMQLFSFDPDAVETVTIDNDEGHFEIAYVDAGWELTKTDYPHEIRLNSPYITAIATYMCDLTAVQKIEAGQEKLPSYGLDKPAVVTCTTKDASYTVCVGTASVTEEYWYVMVPDDSFVYAVDYTEGETLRGGTLFLKDRHMLESSDVAINAFCLQSSDGSAVDLVNTTGLWEMRPPMLMAVAAACA